jgi:hypothetical protein
MVMKRPPEAGDVLQGTLDMLIRHTHRWWRRLLAHALSCDFLFGIKPLDPVSFIATPLVLSVVALFSIWMPAIRATRVDPMAALRIE